MAIIFKALPSQYANQLLDGTILFRNLVYFKKIESDPRSDALEGKHVDAPSHDVKITVVKTGREVVGRFQYHNCLERMDRVFCFCTALKKEALSKFGDACIAIEDSDEFGRRIAKELVRRRGFDLDAPPLIAKEVTYYDVAKTLPPGVDVKNPRHLPFLKRTTYAGEAEFRYVWARHGGFALKQMIVNELFSEADELRGRRAASFVLDVGSIRDIAKHVSF